MLPSLARGAPQRLVAWSQGSGPTVLLSHGWGAHAGHLSAFVPALVGAGFRAVSFDHVGHGASAGTHANVAAFRAGLLAVARACLGADDRLAGIVAHSLGATTTMLALGNDLSPLTTANTRFVLVAPPLDPVRYALDTFAQLLGVSAARQAALLHRLRLDPDTRLDPAQLLRQLQAETRRALVVHDHEDRTVPFADGEAVAAAWTGSRLHPTRGLGHRRILADPAVVAAAVDFLAGG